MNERPLIIVSPEEWAESVALERMRAAARRLQDIWDEVAVPGASISEEDARQVAAALELMQVVEAQVYRERH